MGFLEKTRKRAGMTVVSRLTGRQDETNYFAGFVGAATERR